MTEKTKADKTRAELETELAQVKERLVLAEAGGNAVSQATTTTKPVWNFVVTASVLRTEDGVVTLPERKIMAVDESEAIRLYILRTKYATGTPVDAVKHTFTAVCQDNEKRLDASVAAKRKNLKDRAVPKKAADEILEQVRV